MAKLLKAMIFGSNGQDGYYLSKLFERKHIEFICISHKGNAIHGDVGNYDFVEKQIKEYQPSYIFHFAAQSTTEHFALFENHQTICTGTLNILEAVKLHCPKAKVFIPGSALQFKNSGLPIDEQSSFEASSPYAIARIHSVYAARYYRTKFGLQVYVGYFFHHDSPFRAEHHINQKIVKTVNRISAGSSEKLELGNIEIKKEFNFAGDIIEAVWLLVNQNIVFEAVIGSGIAYTIREWADYCFNRINKNWQEYIIIKNNYHSEYDVLVSNPNVMKSLGWVPEVNFHQLADMMMGDTSSM